MDTIKIERGTRYYPAGLAALGEDAPAAVYVRGNRSLLTVQAIVVDGTVQATPRGQADAAALGSGIADTDVVVVGDEGSVIGASAVVAAGPSGVLVVRPSLSPSHRAAQLEFEEKVVTAGGTVVSFTPEGVLDDGSDAHLRRIAAMGEMTLLPEADSQPRSIAVAQHAKALGRQAVAVLPQDRAEAVEGIYQLSGRLQVSFLTGSEGLPPSPDQLTSLGRAATRLIPPPLLRTATDELMAQLDRLEFSRRVSDLRQAERISGDTERMLFDMASDSQDLTQFKARMYFGGARMMPAAEYQYLVSALETPEGQRPQTWAEASAYAKAWGVDRYESVRHTQQIERDQAQQQAPAYAM